MTSRKVYFVQETVIDDNGNYIPCIAVEGESGYYKTNWQWGKNITIATECATQKNDALGIDEKTAVLIILGTMRSR